MVKVLLVDIGMEIRSPKWRTIILHCLSALIFKRNLSPVITLNHAWLTSVIKVEKRLKLEKEMDIRRLLITEEEEKSSPDTSQVNI